MLVMPSSGGFECGNQRKISATPSVQKSETPDRSVTALGIFAEQLQQRAKKGYGALLRVAPRATRAARRP